MEGGGNPFGYGTQQYTGDNFFGNTLQRFGVTPFTETAIGQSFLGDALNYFGPRDKDGNRIASSRGFVDSALGAFSTLGALKEGTPEGPKYNLTGYGVRSDTGFSAGRASLLPLGNNGQVLAAAQRNQEYFARQVQGIGFPTASRLPTPTSIASSISTSAGQRSAYKKLTG